MRSSYPAGRDFLTGDRLDKMVSEAARCDLKDTFIQSAIFKSTANTSGRSMSMAPQMELESDLD